MKCAKFLARSKCSGKGAPVMVTTNVPIALPLIYTRDGEVDCPGRVVPGAQPKQTAGTQAS